jgi:4-amino-4-deoxychorismate lyase
VSDLVLVLVTRPVLRDSGASTSPNDPAPGFVFADPAAPQLSVLDLGVTRGDGVFESVLVRDGRAPALDAHLARFASSARILDFPEPDLAVWGRAFAAAVEAASTRGQRAFGVKLVLTRGIEGSAQPTAWLLAQPAPDFAALRVGGVAAVTLDRGYRHDAARTAPWLLQGAKTLSYEINAAALREAERRVAREVVFVSSDGFVLEAPTSSVIVRFGDRMVTPPSELGIVPGTTVRRAFEFFAQQGFETASQRLRASELQGADALWLVSSIRQAVPVTALDGAGLELDEGLTARLNTWLGD